MSVSLPSIAIFPGAPAGTPLAASAEGLAAFGSLPANPDGAPAFGSMLAAATAAPAEPTMASVATQGGPGNPPTLATPGGAAAPASPEAMPIPFHWSCGEETKRPSISNFAPNAGLSVELGMDASADRGGMATTTAEPATTDASAETVPGEPAATVGTDAQPTVSGRKSEAPTAYRPTSAERPDSTGQEVPVAPAPRSSVLEQTSSDMGGTPLPRDTGVPPVGSPDGASKQKTVASARTQSRRRNLTAPNATRSAAGSATAVAFSTPAAAVTSAGRLEIPATKAGASATPLPLTGGRRNIAGPVVKSAPVSASTVGSDLLFTVGSELARAVGQSASKLADPRKSGFLGVPSSTPVVAKPVSPVPLAAVAVVPTAGMVAPARPALPVGQVVTVAPSFAADIAQSAGSEQPILPGVEVPALPDGKPSVERGPTMQVAAQPTLSAQPAATVAVAPTAEMIAPASPDGKPSAELGSTLPVAVQPGASQFLGDAGLGSLAGSQEATTVAAVYDRRNEAVSPPCSVGAHGAPLPSPASAGQPVSSGQGMPSTPVVLLPVGMTDPVVPFVALPALPATPKTERTASAIAQPKIYEQQIPEEPKESISSFATPSFVRPGSGPLAVPAAVTLETPSDVVDIASFALLTATAPAKTGIPLPIAEEFRANPTGTAPVPRGMLAIGNVTGALANNLTGEAPVPRGMGVPPMFEQVPTIGSEIQHLPTSATPTSTIPALPQPVIVAVNPGATATTFDATALPSTVGEQQILPLPEAALAPIPEPVVDFSPVAADVIAPSNFTDPRRQLQHPVTAVGACLPVRRAQGPEPVEGQAIDPLPSSFAKAPEDKSRASSLLQLNVSADAQPAPLTNLAMPAPVLVPALPGSVAAVSVPVPPIMPAVANPVLTAAPTATLESKVDAPPVVSGQEMPVPAAEPPVAEGSRFTPVAVPPMPVAEPIPVPVPTAVAASAISPARANETRPVVATNVRPVTEVSPVMSSQPVVSGGQLGSAAVVRPTAQPAVLLEGTPKNSELRRPASLLALRQTARASSLPTVNRSALETELGQGNSPEKVAAGVTRLIGRPSLRSSLLTSAATSDPIVLPAEEIAGQTDDGADAAPQLPRTETARGGYDLASALAASLNAISTPVVSEPGSEPTEETGAHDDLGNWRTTASVPRQAPVAGISPGTPMDPVGRPANFAPTAVVATAGLPADSSPVSAPAVSVGAELPDTASVAAFSSQLPAASRQPISALPGDSPDILPSAEDAKLVAPGVVFPPQTAAHIRPTAEAVVLHSASTSAPILAETTQSDVAVDVRSLQRRPGLPTSPVTPTATISGEFHLPGANAAPAASGQGADVTPGANQVLSETRLADMGETPMPRLPAVAGGTGVPPVGSSAHTEADLRPVTPESPRAFLPAAPTGDTAATQLPATSLGEVRGQPASVAAVAETSSMAEMPVAGAVPEKFAVRFAPDGAEPRGLAERVSVKNTLNVVGQQEEMPTAHAGINAAKKSGTMLSDQPQTSSAAPTSKSPAPAADAAARFDVATIAVPKPEPNRTEWVQPAGRTLAIVRDVAEHMQTTANRVVEFDVSSQPGAHLSVRLEYRGGVVHTTFRTDSTELRETLAREWQATMPSVVAGERSVRLTEPTFTAAPAPRGENQSLDLGGQTTRQQRQDTPQPQEKSAFSSDFAFARGASARSTAASVPAADTSAAPTLRPDTAQHLHAFA